MINFFRWLPVLAIFSERVVWYNLVAYDMSLQRHRSATRRDVSAPRDEHSHGGLDTTRSSMLSE